MQGILRAPTKKDNSLQDCSPLPAGPRVSFACHDDGIIKRRVSFYAADSWSIFNDITPIDTVECNNNYVQVPQPNETSALVNQIKNLRSLIQSIQQGDINISTSSDTSSAPGYLERRHSMLDLCQTGQQHQQDR
ncbi:hypothetical protein ACHAWX_002315, partial [Stephanocyclus meneghinianus]